MATIVLYALPELLRGFANYRMLIYAIVLIINDALSTGHRQREYCREHVWLKKFKGKRKKKEAA